LTYLGETRIETNTEMYINLIDLTSSEVRDITDVELIKKVLEKFKD